MGPGASALVGDLGGSSGGGRLCAGSSVKQSRPGPDKYMQ